MNADPRELLRDKLRRSVNIIRQNDALKRTGADLAHAIASIATDLRRTPDPIDRALVDIDDMVARRARDRTAAQLDDAVIDQMIPFRSRWRITRAVYGVEHACIWPPRPGMTAEDVLAECRVKIVNELGRAGHWTYDGNRLVALRQAEKALGRLTGVNGECREATVIDRRLYDLINPSDPITFRATPTEAGVIAAIMGASLLFVRDVVTGEAPDTSTAKDDRKAIWSDADAIASYAKAWDSFLVGSPRARKLFDEAVSKMTAEDAATYRAKWHDEKRSSMNDICQTCWDAAARIAAEKPDAAALPCTEGE